MFISVRGLELGMETKETLILYSFLRGEERYKFLYTSYLIDSKKLVYFKIFQCLLCDVLIWEK